MKLNAEQKKTLDAALKALKKSNDVDFFRLSDTSSAVLPVLPTGIFALDHRVLGIGGFRKGMIFEAFGVEGGGKSTLVLQLAAETQRRGGLVAYVDIENALNPAYAAALGVNVDDLLVTQPQCGEDALQAVINLMETGLFALIIVDSVASLVPRAELEGEMSDQNVGLVARIMSKALRKMTGLANRTQTTAFFINQLRDVIGGMAFGPKSSTPGGRALKFFSSVRLDVARIGQIKTGDVIVGNKSKITAKKNRLAAPFREAELDLIFGLGFDGVASLTDEAISLGVWKKSGSSYLFVDTGETITGRNNLRDALRENQDLHSATFAATLKALGKSSAYIEAVTNG